MINSYSACFFLSGLYIGSYANLFSKLVISGLVVFIVHPDYFEPRRFSPLYQKISDATYPYISNFYTFSLPQKLPPLNSKLN